MDSGFQAMDSSLQLGLWIPIISGISEPLSWIFPNSKSQDSGYFHKQIFQDSGFHKKKFAGFRNLGSSHGAMLCITYYSFSQTVFVMNRDESCICMNNKCMYEAVGKSYQFLFMLLNFLEIPRIFLKANLRSSTKVWNSLSVPCQLSCSHTL